MIAVCGAGGCYFCDDAAAGVSALPLLLLPLLLATLQVCDCISSCLIPLTDDPTGVVAALTEALRRGGGGTAVLMDGEGQVWTQHLPPGRYDSDSDSDEDDDDFSGDHQLDDYHMAGLIAFPPQTKQKHYLTLPHCCYSLCHRGRQQQQRRRRRAACDAAARRRGRPGRRRSRHTRQPHASRPCAAESAGGRRS